MPDPSTSPATARSHAGSRMPQHWLAGSTTHHCLQVLRLQAPCTSNHQRPAVFESPPALALLPALRWMELSGFRDFSLHHLPATLRVLRLRQRFEAYLRGRMLCSVRLPEGIRESGCR